MLCSSKYLFITDTAKKSHPQSMENEIGGGGGGVQTRSVERVQRELGVRPPGSGEVRGRGAVKLHPRAFPSAPHSRLRFGMSQELILRNQVNAKIQKIGAGFSTALSVREVGGELESEDVYNLKGRSKLTIIKSRRP